MRALVTGAGGFLGFAIAEQLVARGDTVRGFSRGDHPRLEVLGVESQRGDLADPDAVRRAVEGCDQVFHVAAKAGAWGPYREYYDTNVRGTANVIAACRKHGVRDLIYTSTPSVTDAFSYSSRNSCKLIFCNRLIWVVALALICNSLLRLLLPLSCQHT